MEQSFQQVMLEQLYIYVQKKKKKSDTDFTLITKI